MSSKKSKSYTVDGKQYAFGFDANGKVNSVFNVSGRTGKKNPIPVNPNTNAFSDIVNSASGTDAYNKQKFKGQKDSYLSHANGDRAVRATASELNSEYVKNSKSNTNEQFIEEENTDTVVENATVPGISGVLLNEGMLQGIDVIVLLVSCLCIQIQLHLATLLLVIKLF